MRGSAGAVKTKLALFLCAIAATLLFAAPASADLSFCPLGTGTGQCGALLDFSSVRGLAADQETGRLYVADEGNNRVDVFKDDGSFLFAFGFGVADGATNAFQTCTATCFKGIGGGAPGQLDHPATVAVDNDPASPSQHAIYVGERGADEGLGKVREHPRLQKFDPAGEFVWVLGEGVDKTDGGDLCTKAEAHICGAGVESFAEGGIANQPLVATGPGGVLYVVDHQRDPAKTELVKQRLQRFEPSGALIPSQAILFESFLQVPSGLAVDSAGNAWVSGLGGQGLGLRKYSPAGALLAGPFDGGVSFPFASLSFDETGTLYAGQFEKEVSKQGDFSAIAAYNSAGDVLRRFSYARFYGGAGVAINALAAHSSAFGDIFFSDKNGGITYVSEPPPGPVIAAPSVEVISVGNTKATLYAEVNPEGKPTEVHVEYLTQKAYEDQGSSFVGPATKSSEAVSLGAEGFELKAAEALAGCPEATKALSEAGKCLKPETEYRFRVIAENADGKGNSPVEGEPFTTKAPVEFGDTYATGVGTDAAVLHAEVNPLGIPTTAHFEYVDDATFQQSGFAEAIQLPNVGEGAAPLDYGAGEALTARAATAYPLAPATTYHYRLVATDSLLEAPLTGPVRAFTTFRAAQGQGCSENEASRIGFGGLLPDCRAYEMVSPVDKDSGDIRVLKGNGGELRVLEQASDSGEKLAYGSIRSFGDAASAPFTSQYIAQRVEGSEWQTHSIDSPRGPAVVNGVLDESESEFHAFSPDLCEGWQVTFAEPPLAPGGVAGYENLYRRADQLCGEDGEAHYEALAPISTPELDSNELLLLELEGISGDRTRAIFASRGKLQPEGSPGVFQLYLSAAGGTPHLVCILPDGSTVSRHCTAGTSYSGNHRVVQLGRISADGSRVFWSDATQAEGKLYVRENAEAPESARLHGAATGKGNLIGPATATGNVVGGSELVKNVKAESGAFAVGQEISDKEGFIPAKATIKAIEETSPGVFTLTLSAKATKLKLGDSLTGAASATVLGIVTETGAFQAGQEISAAGIPADATVLSCAPTCGPGATSLTLSAKATKTVAGAHLSATSPCTEAETKACTVAVSKAAEEEVGTDSSWFWGATADGSKAIFSTGGFGSGKANLYSFEPDGEVTELLAEGVYGVMGMSEDAGRIYFTSSKVLDAGATEGKANLYFYEAGDGGGITKFIATLAVPTEGILTYRVAPGGLHAAFVSVASLTGYDNIGATAADATHCGGAGARCPEVYRYDAEADDLLCVSCNPSGARPAGAATIPEPQTYMHGARVLADDGSRLYFESSDALVPRDSNGATDVYQWEAPSTGTCEESSPTYSPQDGGCIDLLSSGKSPLDSRFVEADPSGENVFVATGSSLLPQDPGGVDIYDARVGGGLPIPQGPPPGCEGEACQSPPEAPNDPTPASLSFEGAGNVHETTPPTRTPCAKGKVRRHGKCVAKKHRKRAKRRARHSGRAGR